VGIFFFPASIVGVVRLASPRSPWARRFYSDDGKRMERSRERWRRIEARRRRVSDLIAGAPAPDAPDS
jgi:lysyl-tRNA synthetase class 2